MSENPYKSTDCKPPPIKGPPINDEISGMVLPFMVLTVFLVCIWFVFCGMCGLYLVFNYPFEWLDIPKFIASVCSIIVFGYGAWNLVVEFVRDDWL